MFLPSHRSTRSTILVLWLLAVWLLQTVAGPGAAGATIYAPMTDADLADRSALIAEVRVLAVEAAPGDRIATDYLVEVERLIKGALPRAIAGLFPRRGSGQQRDGASQIHHPPQRHRPAAIGLRRQRRPQPAVVRLRPQPGRRLANPLQRPDRSG